MNWFLSRQNLGERPVLDWRRPISHQSSVCFWKAHERHILGVMTPCQATLRAPRVSSLHHGRDARTRGCSLPQRSLCSWMALRATGWSRCARLPWVCPERGCWGQAPPGDGSWCTRVAPGWLLRLHTRFCPLSRLQTERWEGVGFTPKLGFSFPSSPSGTSNITRLIPDSQLRVFVCLFNKEQQKIEKPL